MTKTIDRDHAHQVVSDLLRELEGQADPFLDEVLQRHGVRGLRVVGPLTDGNMRCSLQGPVGGLGGQGSRGRWVWEVRPLAHPGGVAPPGGGPVGYAPTRLAADRALCLALRELGLCPVEVPTEEAVREAAERELPRDMEYLRTDAELRAEVQRSPGAAALDPYALATATGADLDRLAEQVGVRRQSAREPGP
jgi:hypothetical protein